MAHMRQLVIIIEPGLRAVEQDGASVVFTYADGHKVFVHFKTQAAAVDFFNEGDFSEPGYVLVASDMDAFEITNS
jgi:hypothetical protein